MRRIFDRSALLRFGLVGLLTATSACATTGGASPRGTTASAAAPRVQAYKAYRASTTSAASERWFGLLAVLELDGWTIVASDAQQKTLVALHPRDNAELRDHLMVQLEEDRTMLSLRTESRGANGWDHSDVVCASYGYARERSIGELIEQGAIVASRGGEAQALEAGPLHAAR